MREFFGLFSFIDNQLTSFLNFGYLVQEDINLAGPTGPNRLASVPENTQGLSVWELATHSGGVVLFVLILLLIMSVITWAIVGAKVLQFSKAKQESKRFSEIFWNTNNLAQVEHASKSLIQSPVAAVFSSGYQELKSLLEAAKGNPNSSKVLDLSNVERALRRAKTNQMTRLEKGTNFLATTASAAPFIGLFGTVWGIMTAFIGLSSATTTSIQAVAPGISEALIATAIGLVAAIPAAIGYNYLNQELRILGREMDMFSAELLNIARRDFLLAA